MFFSGYAAPVRQCLKEKSTFIFSMFTDKLDQRSAEQEQHNQVENSDHATKGIQIFNQIFFFELTAIYRRAILFSTGELAQAG